MTDNRETYLEFLHGELDASARDFAGRLHEEVATSMTEAFQGALGDILAEFDLGEEFTEEGEALILPGMRYRIYHHLARICEDTARGWADVFFTGLNTKYDTEGGIER